MTHFAALEADFAHHYQIDLPAAVWGSAPLSARRVGALVKGLPSDSSFGRELNPYPGWGNVEELLVKSLEQIDLGNRILHAAFCEPPHPDPIRIDRPWQTQPDRPPMATVAEMKAFLTRSRGAV